MTRSEILEQLRGNLTTLGRAEMVARYRSTRPNDWERELCAETGMSLRMIRIYAQAGALPWETRRKLVNPSLGDLQRILRGEPARPVNEIDFTHHVIAALGSRPDMRAWRQNVGAVKVAGRVFHAGPPRGAADITGIIEGGRRLEVELKMHGGKLRPEQESWRRMVLTFGGVYVLYEYDDSKSLDDNVEACVLEVHRCVTS